MFTILCFLFYWSTYMIRSINATSDIFCAASTILDDIAVGYVDVEHDIKFPGVGGMTYFFTQLKSEAFNLKTEETENLKTLTTNGFLLLPTAFQSSLSAYQTEFKDSTCKSCLIDNAAKLLLLKASNNNLKANENVRPQVVSSLTSYIS